MPGNTCSLIKTITNRLSQALSSSNQGFKASSFPKTNGACHGFITVLMLTLLLHSSGGRELNALSLIRCHGPNVLNGRVRKKNIILSQILYCTTTPAAPVPSMVTPGVGVGCMHIWDEATSTQHQEGGHKRMLACPSNATST